MFSFITYIVLSLFCIESEIHIDDTELTEISQFAKKFKMFWVKNDWTDGWVSKLMREKWFIVGLKKKMYHIRPESDYMS